MRLAILALSVLLCSPAESRADCILNDLIIVRSGQDVIGTSGADRIECLTDHYGSIIAGAGADRVLVDAGVTMTGAIDAGTGSDSIVLREGSRLTGLLDAGSGANSLRLDGAVLDSGVKAAAGPDRLRVSGAVSIAGRVQLGGGRNVVAIREASLSTSGGPDGPWGGITSGGRGTRAFFVNSQLQAVSQSGEHSAPPARFAFECRRRCSLTAKNAVFDDFTVGFGGGRNSLRLFGGTRAVRAYMTQGRNSALVARQAQADLLRGGAGRDRFIIRGSASTVEGGPGADDILISGHGASAQAVAGGHWSGGTAWSDEDDVAAVCSEASVGYLSAARMRLMSGCEAQYALAPYGAAAATLELVNVKGLPPSSFASPALPAELTVSRKRVRDAAAAGRYCRLGTFD